MRVLLLTQSIDKDDPVLGFMHSWIAEFSDHFEFIHAVCLREGLHSLPKNVSVYSLGKEGGISRIKYVWRFFKYAWRFRGEYDAVLVHMNQEYVLLGGWLWKLLRKKVYLWRNHWSGGIGTRLAAMWCEKIFCTSRYSFTARFKRTKLMPIGIDLGTFKPSGTPQPNSVLYLGRIAPSKHVEVLIDAVSILRDKHVAVHAALYGDAHEKDGAYLRKLAKMSERNELQDILEFHPGVPNHETPAVYSAYVVFYNGSGSGMYDKTIFEAAACGSLPLASSKDWAAVSDPRLTFHGDSESLADAIEKLIHLPEIEKEQLREKCARIAVDNSLRVLGVRLSQEMQ